MTVFTEAREMVQWLRTLSTLAEDPGGFQHQHDSLQSSVTPVLGISHFLLITKNTRHTCDVKYTSRENTHTYGTKTSKS